MGNGLLTVIIIGIAIVAFLALGGLQQLSSVGRSVKSGLSNSTGISNLPNHQSTDFTKEHTADTESRGSAIDNSPQSVTMSPSGSSANATSKVIRSLPHVDSNAEFDARAAAIPDNIKYSTSLKGAPLVTGVQFTRDSKTELEVKQREAQRAEVIAKSLYGSDVIGHKSGFDYVDPKTGKVI